MDKPSPFWSSVAELAAMRDRIPEERRAMSGVREVVSNDVMPGPIVADDLSLSVVLSRLGWAHADGGNGRQFVYDETGDALGRVHASTVWCELHRRGLITFRDGHVPRGYLVDGTPYGPEDK